MSELLKRLSIIQLKELIDMFCIEPPHSKSTKQEIITHILNSGANLDEKMLSKHFGIKPTKSKNTDTTDSEKKEKKEKQERQEIQETCVKKEAPAKQSELRRRRTKKNSATEGINPFTSSEILDQLS
jgi:hypothetical protein